MQIADRDAPPVRAGEPVRSRRAWSMVALAFLSQGIAYGMTFGVAGTFIGPAADEFAAGRAAASLGPSLVAMLHGLLGPVVGLWLARGSVRNVMTLGAVLMGAAFLVMHLAPSVWVFSLAFGILGGTAVACLGITAVTTLVGRWFPRGSGRALGLANMPILVTLLPPLAGLVTAGAGWRTTALVMGLTSLAIAPVFRLVRDFPPELHAPAPTIPVTGGATGADRSGFRPDPSFWLLAVAVGIFDGSGITIITHVIPFATETGVDYRQATLLVSAMGLSGLAGAPLLGTLADRIGGPRTLALVAVLLAIGWATFLASPPYALLMANMALLGFCGGAFAGLAGTSLATLYPGPRLGPAIGLSVMVALPFNFALPLLAGYVHDRTGNYRLAFQFQLALFLAAFAMLAGVRPRRAEELRPPAASA